MLKLYVVAFFFAILSYALSFVVLSRDTLNAPIYSKTARLGAFSIFLLLCLFPCFLASLRLTPYFTP